MAFACVDGPEFDGLQVDFDELLARAKRFDPFERESMRRFRDNTSATYPSSPFPLGISQSPQWKQHPNPEDHQDHRQDQDRHAGTGIRRFARATGTSDSGLYRGPGAG